MSRNQALSAVLQTVVLLTCSLIVSHHFFAAVSDNFTSNELYQNFTTRHAELAANASRAQQSRLSGIEPGMTIGNHTVTNVTWTPNANSTTITNSSDGDESFYWTTLPKELFVYIFVSILCYYWHIGLERALPARPRPSAALVDKKFEDDDSREEEVVKKWIAQGKIQRGSLSWCNTLLKWLLDVVVGGLWISAVRCIVDRFLRKAAPPTEGPLFMQVVILWAVSLAGARPLASLVAFIVAPAHKRIVFVAGVDLAFWIFLGCFANIVVPWFATTEFARQVMGNLTMDTMGDITTDRLTDEL